MFPKCTLPLNACHASLFVPISAIPNYTAPYFLHSAHPSIPTPHLKRDSIVLSIHHGTWPNVGTGCQEEKTCCIPPYGMRSKSRAVHCSPTTPTFLLSTLGIHSPTYFLQTGLGYGHCQSSPLLSHGYGTQG
jgi:hypothetical protein